MLKRVKQVSLSDIMFVIMVLIPLIALPYSSNTISQNVVLVPLYIFCSWFGSKIALGQK